MTRRYALIALLLLIAYAVRVYRLDAVPLRGDEAYSVMHWTAPPLTERWERLVRDEPAPVGAFTMYWAWSGLTGRSEFAVRYLSLLGNLAGLAVIIALTKRLTGRWTLAYLAGGLWVVHPYLIWHAQDARVYGVLSALTPLTFYWLWRAIRAYQIKSFWAAWTPYIAVQTAAIYLYYFEPFWVAAQGIFVLWYALRGREGGIKVLRAAVRAWITVGVLCVPVMAQLFHLMFVSEYQGNADEANVVLLFTDFVPTLLFGDNMFPAAVGAGIALAIFGGLLWISRRKRWTALLLLLWIFVPPLILYGASFYSSFFRPRYVTTVIPALIMALVIVPYYMLPSHNIFMKNLKFFGVTFFAKKVTKDVKLFGFVYFFTIIIATISIVEVWNYFHVDEAKSADWPSLLAYLDERTTPNDAIITDAIDPALEYYHDDPANIVFVPKIDPDPAEFMPDVIDTYTAYYLLAGQRTGSTGQYLQENAQPIPGDKRDGVIQYRNWHVDPAEIQHPLDLQFGDVAVLRGYTVLPNAAILLYWEALSQTEVDYSVLLHIEAAPDAPPVAVLDHAIAGAVISTRTWQPGTLYRDPVAIDLPPGTYTIRAGMYAAGATEQLPVVNADTDETRYPIGVLEVSDL